MSDDQIPKTLQELRAKMHPDWAYAIHKFPAETALIWEAGVRAGAAAMQEKVASNLAKDCNCEKWEPCQYCDDLAEKIRALPLNPGGDG